MKLRNVRKYKTPGYPQKTEVSNNPELLRNLPSRWKGNLYACVAASSLFMVALSGCGRLGDNSVNTGNSALNRASQTPVNTGDSALNRASQTPVNTGDSVLENASQTPVNTGNSVLKKASQTPVNTGDSVLNKASQTPVNTGVAPTSKKSAPGVIPPVFVHGDGSGSFGCVSVAPPVFLSEEEAYQVICDEARAYGMGWK